MLALSLTVTAWSQDDFFTPYISVPNTVKNIRVRYFPINKEGKPDYTEYLIQAASDRLLAHEAAHVVQQREGVLIRKFIANRQNLLANLMIRLVLYKVGQSNVPFDTSVFLGQLHFEVIGESLTGIADRAGQIAKLKHVYQHNQSDLAFLRGRKSKCYEKQCDKDLAVAIDNRIAELEKEQFNVSVNLKEQLAILEKSISNNREIFNTLTNVSKSRHEKAMNAIRNMK